MSGVLGGKESEQLLGDEVDQERPRGKHIVIFFGSKRGKAQSRAVAHSAGDEHAA